MSQFKLVMPVKLRLFLLIVTHKKKLFDVYLLTKLHTLQCVYSLYCGCGLCW